MRKVIEGSIYQHFKGNEYKILCLALNTETNEQMVIYQDVANIEKIFARSYDMFISEVDHDKYPDVKQFYRFEEKQ